MGSMRSIGVDGMMRHNRKKGCGARALQFRFEPCKLFCLLLRGQGKVLTEQLLITILGHVAIERQEGNQRILSRKLEAIPTGGHCPTSVSVARVLELGIHFALRPTLIIVVP